MNKITDTDRINWIEKNSYGLRSRRRGTHNLIVWNSFDLRETIDCAMEHCIVMQKGGREELLHRKNVVCSLRNIP